MELAMGSAVWPTEYTDNTERIGKIRMKFMVRAFKEVANGPFNGQIRDLQIHRRVLTEAELRAAAQKSWPTDQRPVIPNQFSRTCS